MRKDTEYKEKRNKTTTKKKTDETDLKSYFWLHSMYD